MSTNEIINVLCNMENRDMISSMTPLQKKEISDATTIEISTIQDGDKILKRVSLLSLFGKNFDWYKAEYFCLVYVRSNYWKVFVLDRFYNVLGRLEDYKGTIRSANGSPIDRSFRLRMQ